MAWFFTEHNIKGNQYIITGEDAKHISKVLRMSRGEELTIVTPDKTQCLCEVFSINSDSVTVDVISKKPCENEPDVFVTLYQALPKSDKMELIIQKAVELGADEIVPVEMARSVVKLLGNKKDNKTIRWQAISESAAKQSKRVCVPTVSPVISFKNALVFL